MVTETEWGFRIYKRLKYLDVAYYCIIIVNSRSILTLSAISTK